MVSKKFRLHIFEYYLLPLGVGVLAISIPLERSDRETATHLTRGESVTTLCELKRPRPVKISVRLSIVKTYLKALGSMFEAEHEFGPPDCLFNRILTTLCGRYLLVVRSVRTLPLKYTQPPIAFNCLFVVPVKYLGC